MKVQGKHFITIFVFILYRIFARNNDKCVFVLYKKCILNLAVFYVSVGLPLIVSGRRPKAPLDKDQTNGLQQ